MVMGYLHSARFPGRSDDFNRPQHRIAKRYPDAQDRGRGNSKKNSARHPGGHCGW